MYPHRRAARVIFVIALSAASPFPAGALAQANGRGTPKDMYFMLLFSQDGGRAPRLAHTYAAFVHARETKPGVRKIVETHSISWLPANLDVRLLRRPEVGRNLGLKQSLDHSMSLGTQISMWGPFEIKKELFDRAVRQEKILNQGKLLYKALDGGVRSDGEGLNCFHAIADIDKDRGLLETGKAYGNQATEMVAQHLRRWIINPRQTYAWVADLLGLQNYPITRRTINGNVAAKK